MWFRALALCALALTPCGAEAKWLNIGPAGGEARSLASDERSDSVFALHPRTGLFRSDHGGPWTLVFDALSRGVTSTRVAVDPNTSRVYLGTTLGLFRSDDLGGNWRSILTEAVVDVSTTSDRLMVATPDRLFRSANAGATWTVIAAPGSGDSVTLVRFDPRNEERAVAVAGGKLFRSSDFGQSWDALTPANVVAAFFGDSLYVGGADGVYQCATDCRRLSTDSAVDVTQWREEIYEATADGIYRLDFQQRRFGLVEGFPDATPFALIATSSSLWAGTTAGIVRSDDGVGWTNAGAGFDNVRITAIVNSGPMIVAATQREGVVRGQDNSWSPAYAGLPGRPPTAPATYALASDGTTLYAAFPDNGLFRSINGGQSWENVSAGLPIRYVLDVAGDAGMTIAATLNGLVRSTDHGATWQTFASYPAVSATAVAVGGPTIATASRATAIISSDGGATWQSSDLPALILDVAVAGSRIYARTDEGLFVREPSGWSGPLMGGARVKAMTAEGARLYVSTSGGIECSDDATVWLHVPDSETLPPDVTALLAQRAVLYVGTDGGSIFQAPVAPRRRVARP